MVRVGETVSLRVSLCRNTTTTTTNNINMIIMMLTCIVVISGDMENQVEVEEKTRLINQVLELQHTLEGKKNKNKPS